MTEPAPTTTDGPSAAPDPADVGQVLNRLRTLWGLLVFAIAMMAYVVYMLSREVGEPPMRELPWVGWLLAAVAVSILATAPLVRRHLQSKPGSPRPSVFPNIQLILGGPTGHPRLDRYSSAKATALVMREGAGALGFVVGFLVEPRYGYLVIAAAVLALALAWPRASEVEALGRRR